MIGPKKVIALLVARSNLVKILLSHATIELWFDDEKRPIN